MPASAIRVQDYRDLQRAFARADKTLKREFDASLKDAAEPIRAEAETRATTQIPRIGVPWSRMRIGVTSRAVYVAPRKRGTRAPSRRRPNLAGLLLDRSMVPALEANIRDVERRVDDVLGTVGRAWERG